jgi:hypothetical protein
MFFRAFATTTCIIVDTAYAALQLVHTFANRAPVPAQFPFGTPLSAFSKELDYAGHENTSLTTFERPCRLDEKCSEFIVEFHLLSP